MGSIERKYGLELLQNFTMIQSFQTVTEAGVPAQAQSKHLALGQHVPAQTPRSSLRALPLPLAMDYNNLC